jgi:hypothetical protein
MLDACWRRILRSQVVTLTEFDSFFLIDKVSNAGT